MEIIVDERSAVKNGVLQIIAGVVSIVFTIAAYHFFFTTQHAGLWSGAFFVIGGVFVIFAGVHKRDVSFAVASLAFAVVNVVVAAANFYFILPPLAFHNYYYHCWKKWKEEYECSDWEYKVTDSLLIVLTMAGFAQFVGAVWNIVIASRAIRNWRNNNNDNRKTVVERKASFNDDVAATTAVGAPADASINKHAKSSSIMTNSVAQASTTVVSMTIGVVILLIVGYGVRSGKEDRRFVVTQTVGSSLWVGPVFLSTAYLGFRAARFGENSSLIGFLCLDVLDAFLSMFEMMGPAVALANRYAMRSCDFDEDDLPKYCSFRFEIPLIVLNSLVIVAAVVHFALSIWGVVAAAVALRRDETCDRCCCHCCCRGRHRSRLRRSVGANTNAVDVDDNDDEDVVVVVERESSSN